MQTEKNAFKFTDAHKATQEHATKFGLTLPAFAEKGISFDAYAITSNVNPYQYTDEGIVYLRDEYEGVDSLMFVFGIALGMDTEIAMKKIGAWTHELAVDGEKCHIAYHTMGNFDDRKLRAFIYRVYANDENQCEEHSEMHKGQPMGMYHCPICMEMIVAGLRHPSKSELREFHEELIHDIRDESAVEDDEIWSPGDVEQMVNRAKTGRVSCAEENPACKPSAIPEDEESPEGWTTDYVSEEEFNEVMAENKATFEGRFAPAVKDLVNYAAMKDDWDGDGAKGPLLSSVQFAMKFLVRMAALNSSADEKIGSPLGMLDPDGIVSLYWSQRDGDYISFGFYPENEIVCYYRIRETGAQSSVPMSFDDEASLRKAFVLVQEFGGGKDAQR